MFEFVRTLLAARIALAIGLAIDTAVTWKALAEAFSGGDRTSEVITGVIMSIVAAVVVGALLARPTPWSIWLARGFIASMLVLMGILAVLMAMTGSSDAGPLSAILASLLALQVVMFLASCRLDGMTLFEAIVSASVSVFVVWGILLGATAVSWFATAFLMR